MTDSSLDAKLTKKVIESLNRILELELAGVVRYMHYSFMIFGHNRIPSWPGCATRATSPTPTRYWRVNTSRRSAVIPR